MVLTFRLLLLVLAFICFVLSACGVATRINLQSAGLALWVAAIMFPAG